MTTKHERVYTAIARGLNEFGYRGITADHIRETHEAMKAGKTSSDLPHGIVGMMAEKQIEDAAEMGLLPRIEGSAAQ